METGCHAQRGSCARPHQTEFRASHRECTTYGGKLKNQFMLERTLRATDNIQNLLQRAERKTALLYQGQSSFGAFTVFRKCCTEAETSHTSRYRKTQNAKATTQRQHFSVLCLLHSCRVFAVVLVR